MNSEPDPFGLLKQGVRWMWSLGDYASLAQLLEPYAQRLADELDLHPGLSVLDVAAGNGNFALAGAERGAMVTACDLTPAMVELGRERTFTAGLSIEWFEADAENLPFDNDRFEVVASVFGVIFAPRPDHIARELFRVAHPGGVVAMANYSEGGFLSQVAKLMQRYSRPAPFAMPSPFEWGDDAEVRRRLSPYARSIQLQPGEVTFEFASVDEAVSFWERTNPPHMALRSTLSAEDYARFRDDLAKLMERLNDSAHSLVLKSRYLTVLARK